MATNQGPGRKPINVEFLNTLMKVERIERVKDSAQRCGQAESNMSAYLNGKKRPGIGVLRKSLENLYEWKINPKYEMVEIPEAKDLPESGGVYILYDSAGRVLYVGQAKTFRTEVQQALKKQVETGMRFGPKLRKSRPQIRKLARYLSLYEIESERLRHNLEALLIRVVINQAHNQNIGHFE